MAHRAAVATGDWAAVTVGPEPPLPSPPEATELHTDNTSHGRGVHAPLTPLPPSPSMVAELGTQDIVDMAEGPTIPVLQGVT